MLISPCYTLSTLLTVILAAGFPRHAEAGSIDIGFDLDPVTQVSVDSYMGRDLLLLDGGYVSFEEGCPNLPGRPFAFVIPQGTSLARIEVEIIDRVELPGSYDIDPVRCMTLGAVQGAPPLEFRSAVYLSDEPFPRSPVVGPSSGSKTGFSLAGFTFVPFAYHPLSGRLTLITSARLTLHYEADSRHEPVSLTQTQLDTAKQSLQSWIDNPEMLDVWCPERRSEPPADQETWVVIALEDYQPFLQPLVDHRSAGGLAASFISLEWIQSSYPGWDSPERIRNYLKESFLERGLVYALVVGDDAETIRKSYYVDSYTMDSAADLYFADLDGTWDANGNHRYGEADDSLDYYSDIYVGRLPASDQFDVSVMVDKTLGYETCPPEGEWRTRALVCGALLFPDWKYHGDRLCDSLLQYIPGDWQVDVLLEDPEGWNPDNQLDLFNQGVAFVEPVGHGSYNGIWWMLPDWELIFGTGTVSQMTNGDMLSVWQAISCYPGQLSAEDCFGEWLLKWSGGGAVAVRFNSSVGRANPPYCGPNEYLDIYFADLLFVDGLYRLGVPHAVSKDQLYPTSVPKRLFAIQELNLLADPYLLFIPGQTGIEPGGVQGAGHGGASLSAYPNPASGVCRVTVSGDRLSPGTGIEVYDMSGRLVRVVSIDPQTGTAELDTAGLPSGCYHLFLRTEQGTAASRMVLLR